MDYIEKEDYNNQRSIKLDDPVRGSIFVVPHFDDEVFQFASMLFKYPYNISLVFTHPTDTISSKLFNDQLEMMHKSIDEINAVRISSGFMKITDINVFTSAGPKGISPENYLPVLNSIEQLFNKYGYVDYFGYSLKSTHQSHTESHLLCSSILRSPYLEKIKNVILAPYPQLYHSPSIWGSEDKNFNLYQEISSDNIEVIRNIIGSIYGSKNINTSILGADSFIESLHSFAVGTMMNYAQPYILIKSQI